jgi:hypothetical protein
VVVVIDSLKPLIFLFLLSHDISLIKLTNRFHYQYIINVFNSNSGSCTLVLRLKSKRLVRPTVYVTSAYAATSAMPTATPDPEAFGSNH